MEKEEDFLKIEQDSFTVVFTNAENGRSFNRNTETGINELNFFQYKLSV